MGHRQLTTEELNIYSPKNPPPIPYTNDAKINDTIIARAFQQSCQHMIDAETGWDTNKCEVNSTFWWKNGLGLILLIKEYSA